MLWGKLYDLARCGCRSMNSWAVSLEIFAELHLPLDFLSQTEKK